MLESVRCVGNESDLLSCPRSGLKRQECTPRLHGVGVDCAGRGERELFSYICSIALSPLINVGFLYLSSFL